MDENPYRSPTLPAGRMAAPRRRWTLRPAVGVPGVLLMFAFAFMVGVAVVDQIGSANGLMRISPRRLIGFGPVLLLGLMSVLSGSILAARMIYEWLRPESAGSPVEAKNSPVPPDPPTFP